MPSDNQYEVFVNQKRSFFSSKPTLQTIETEAFTKDYAFLLENQKSKLIETEFNTLMAALKRKKHKDEEQFWLWCYYCASLLESFYDKKAYNHKKNKERIAQAKKDIAYYLKHKKHPSRSEEDFITYLANQFKDNFLAFIQIPLHLSDTRDFVSSMNLYRVYWAFIRMTITKGLKLAESLHWLEQLDVFLGTQTDINQIIAVFENPYLVLVLSSLSVALFLARFVIDTILLLSHTFDPSELEAQNTTKWERFKHEFYKRHFRQINDLFWAIINFTTNFNYIFGISDPIAASITALALFFDVAMALYQLYWAMDEYLTQKEMLKNEILYYQMMKELAQVAVLEAQLLELKINFKVQQSSIVFQASGAFLLAFGFSLSLSLSSPALILGAHFLCVVGLAFYLSSKAFNQYREKAEYKDRLPMLGVDEASQAKALQEFETARLDFILTLSKNIIVPMVLITVFAVYWPAAIVLTALYLGAEATKAYLQHNTTNEAKRLDYKDSSSEEGCSLPNELAYTT